MKDYLKPHRNLAAEAQLKTSIQQIQSLMGEPENNSTVENILKEATKFIKAPNRILDLTVIEHYESWTDLDSLVGELTMEVPMLPAVSKEDFVSIVQEIREVIESGQVRDNVPLNYYMDFYRAFFALNFPNVAEDGIFDEIFEDTSLDKLVDLHFCIHRTPSLSD